MGKYYCIFFLAAMLLPWAAAEEDERRQVMPPVDGEDDRTCEVVESIICQSVERMNASFPNPRDQSQSAAVTEIMDFLILFNSGCSGAVVHFYCAYYFPFCAYTSADEFMYLYPCKSFCEFVRERCEPAFDDFSGVNLDWPEFLNCSGSSFPDGTPENLECFAPPNPQDLTIPTISGILTPPPVSHIRPTETSSVMSPSAIQMTATSASPTPMPIIPTHSPVTGTDESPTPSPVTGTDESPTGGSMATYHHLNGISLLILIPAIVLLVSVL